MKKLVNTVLIVLVIAAVVPMLLWMFGVFGPFEHAPEVFGGADVMLAIAALYLALGIVALVGLTAANMGKSRSTSRIGLYVFGGLALVAIVSYFTFAQAVPVIGADGKVFDNPFTLRITDAMLYTTYIAVGLTVIFLLWGVVRKALK